MAVQLRMAEMIMKNENTDPSTGMYTNKPMFEQSKDIVKEMD